MSPSRLLGVWALALCLGGLPALGQPADGPRLSAEIMQTTTVISAEQQQAIDQFQEYWVDRLAAGRDYEIAEARNRLVEPFNFAGATRVFIPAYSGALSRRLLPLLRSNDVAVRVNTMIVAQHLTDNALVDVVQQGLKDPNPAVRYRAAKAVGEIGARDDRDKRLAPATKEALLTALIQASRAESQMPVANQMLVGLIGLIEIDAARKELSELLSQRVALHAQDPNLPVKPDLDGLRALYRYLAQRLAAAGVSAREREDDLRTLTLLAGRMLILAATILDEQRADPGMESQYRRMVEDTDNLLRWTVRDQLTPELEIPRPIQQEIRNRDWKVIRLRAEEWRALLRGAPLNFEDARLAVSFP